MHHTQYLDLLRQKGHRLTPQREMILSVICSADGHIAADEILKRVRKRYPYVNKSAVYRTLDLLTRLGVINPTDMGQGCVEYEVHRHPHHHHLICHHCGMRIEADEDIFAPLEKRLHTDYGFVADLDHFAIFGLCRKCSRSVQPTEKNHAHS
jgi:Fur family transcriptional regulator, ferric uptake regulator